MIKCPKCKSVLPEPLLSHGDLVRCPYCNNLPEFLVNIFPAYYKETTKETGPEFISTSEDSSCFFHKDKIATSVCNECGAYLCSLCTIKIEETNYCSSCFRTKRNHIKSIKRDTLLKDSMALLASLISILTCYLGIIAGPIIIIFCIINWNKIETPYKRSKWRFVAAIVLSSISFLVTVGTIISIISLSNS